MSYKAKMTLPILGMALVFGFAAIKVASTGVQEVEHPLPASITRLDEVKMIEVKDASEQVVLSGSFSGSIAGQEGEMTVVLTATSVDPDAMGKSSIEIETKNGFTEQELELEVKKLAPGSAFKLFLDGGEAASFTTNHKGEAELELSNEPSK